MNKLLNAGFARMFKSRLFWVLTGLCGLFGGLMRLYAFLAEKRAEQNVPLDSGFFVAAVFIGFVMAVFCSLFVGTEYSDGTIRNKLVIGHTRIAVYFSNLILCIAAGVLFCLSNFAVSLIVGIPLSGFFTGSISSVLFSAALQIALVAAYSSLFVMIGFMNQNKAIVAILTLLIAFTFFIMSTFIYSSLNEPKTYDAYSYTENGITVSEDAHPNPNYLTGTKRAVYEFLYDYLPGCQGSRIAGMYEPGPEAVFALYSLLTVAVTSAAGILVFQRKNIK